LSSMEPLSDIEALIPDPSDLISMPDEADRQIDRYAQDSVCVDRYDQFGGRTVYALTVGKGPISVFISRPHAHEPGGTAACWLMLDLLVGSASAAQTWRENVLERFTLTFVPDANPGGSQRSPVRFWDGSQIPNETFFLWMFGERGDAPGERFPRVPAWDSRETPPPKLLGIAYEQIDDHIYVEPNRDHRSTLFRSFFDLNETYAYHAWIDLHQTEYVGSPHNCHVNLPTGLASFERERQDVYTALGEAIHTRWIVEGARPRTHPGTGYKRGTEQSEYLFNAWNEIDRSCYHLVTEVQNNNTRTPVRTQVRLQVAAVDSALCWLAANLGEGDL
jgi:hypothetical protein